MAVISVICTGCSSPMNVDERTGLGVCDYCGKTIRAQVAVRSPIVSQGVNRAELHDKATFLWGKGKWHEAVGCWQKIISTYETDGDAYIGLCKYSLKQKVDYFERDPYLVAKEWKDECITKETNYEMAEKYADKNKFDEFEKLRLEQTAPIKARHAEILTSQRHAANASFKSIWFGIIAGLIVYVAIIVIARSYGHTPGEISDNTAGAVLMGWIPAVIVGFIIYGIIYSIVSFVTKK